MIGQKLRRSIRKRIALLKPLRRVNVDGITYDVDCREVIDLQIYYGGWEPSTIAVIREHVKPGHFVLEVGANVGAHTLILAQQVGSDGHVHAIEPTEYAREKLKQNISLNQDLKERITVHNFLITNEHDPAPRRQIKSSWRSSHLVAQRPDENVSSPTISIDDFAEAAGLSRCDFLKIDIDGYDLKAIQGAQSLLKDYSPSIFIELCNSVLLENDATVAELVDTLRGLGYSGIDADTGEQVDDSYLASLAPQASRNGFFVRG